MQYKKFLIASAFAFFASSCSLSAGWFEKAPISKEEFAFGVKTNVAPKLQTILAASYLGTDIMGGAPNYDDGDGLGKKIGKTVSHHGLSILFGLLPLWLGDGAKKWGHKFGKDFTLGMFGRKSAMNYILPELMGVGCGLVGSAGTSWAMRKFVAQPAANNGYIGKAFDDYQRNDDGSLKLKDGKKQPIDAVSDDWSKPGYDRSLQTLASSISDPKKAMGTLATYGALAGVTAGNIPLAACARHLSDLIPNVLFGGKDAKWNSGDKIVLGVYRLFNK